MSVGSECRRDRGQRRLKPLRVLVSTPKGTRDTFWATIVQSVSHSLRIWKKDRENQAGNRRKRPPKSLVGVPKGTYYLKQGDRPDIAPKKFQTMSTPMCSTVDDKKTSASPGFLYINDIDTVTGAEAHEGNMEVVVNETDEICLF